MLDMARRCDRGVSRSSSARAVLEVLDGADDEHAEFADAAIYENMVDRAGGRFEGLFGKLMFFLSTVVASAILLALMLASST